MVLVRAQINSSFGWRPLGTGLNPRQCQLRAPITQRTKRVTLHAIASRHNALDGAPSSPNGPPRLRSRVASSPACPFWRPLDTPSRLRSCWRMQDVGTCAAAHRLQSRFLRCWATGWAGQVWDPLTERLGRLSSSSSGCTTRRKSSSSERSLRRCTRRPSAPKRAQQIVRTSFQATNGSKAEVSDIRLGS
jgi:hypothetical protein